MNQYFKFISESSELVALDRKLIFNESDVYTHKFLYRCQNDKEFREHYLRAENIESCGLLIILIAKNYSADLFNYVATILKPEYEKLECIIGEKYEFTYYLRNNRFAITFRLTLDVLPYVFLSEREFTMNELGRWVRYF